MAHNNHFENKLHNSRIGFLSTIGGSPFGGSEYLWSQTAKRLLEMGVTVGANVHWWPQPAPQIQQLADAGCQMSYRREKTRLQRVAKRLLPLAEKSWFDDFRPDLVVISLGLHTEALGLMQECLRRNIRYVVIIQSVCETIWTPNYKDYAQAYANACACFFVSRANRDYVEAQFAMELPNAKIVRNPYNVPYHTKLAWPSTKEGYKIACIGRYEPCSKGQDMLFAALRNDVWEERPITISLYGSGVYKDNLKALAKMYHLKNVVIHNSVEDIETVWQTHHALVLPSRYEGLPLVVVEAMLSGRICIVTDVAGNAELLEDNVSGFVASGANAHQVHEAMNRAWNHRVKWEQMGLAAKKKAQQLIPADPIAAFVDELAAVLP